MRGMNHLFLPDQWVDSYEQLDLPALHQRGVRVLLCDVDNTLSRLQEQECSLEADAFLRRVKAAGIQPVLVTNNTKKHLDAVFGGHSAGKSYTFCCKPLPFSIWRVLKDCQASVGQAAILGDQLCTDMAAGNLAGIQTILTRPLQKAERGDTKIMRRIEKVLIAHYQRKGIWRRNE